MNGVIESSSGSCGKSGLLGELIEGALVVAGGDTQCAWRGRRGVGELGQAWLEQAGLEVGDEHGVVQSGVGDPVAVAAGDAGDQAVCT